MKLNHLSAPYALFCRSCLVVSFCLGAPTYALTLTEDLLQQEQLAFQQAAAMVADKVVQIETFGGLTRVGEQPVAEGPTTGTIVSPDGWIISSLFSFRQQPASILVSMPDGTRKPAKIVARDYSRELALLKVEGSNDLPHVIHNPKASATRVEPAVGSWVIALGKTYDKRQVSQSIGIVSAVGRAYSRAIQTDAKISPINYGGPLVDLTGEVLGILSPISPGAFLEGDSSEIYDSGIGFAIPIDDIFKRLPSMQQGNDVHPGKLGVVAADQNELAGPVQIAGAMPGSPAARAGIAAGDVLVEAEGRPIRLLADLRHALGPTDAGMPFRFVVNRRGERVEMEAELIQEIPVYQRRYLGLYLAPADEGLLVTAIEDDSPASATRLRVGDRIVACNEQNIQTAADLRTKIAVAELDIPLQLSVVDVDGAEQTLDVLATTWPLDLPQSLPETVAAIDDTMQSSIVDINLGDFPNKAFAVVPPLSGERPLGLLIIYPEPGELTRDRVKDHWHTFASERGWIIAVVNSGNPKQWTREELELTSRVLGRMQKGYDIDKARTVLCGLGVGGRMALASAGALRDKVAGVATINTDLNRFAKVSPNAPLQSLDFFFSGDVEALAKPVEYLRELGYAATSVDGSTVEPQKLESHPQTQLESWLESLGRY